MHDGIPYRVVTTVAGNGSPGFLDGQLLVTHQDALLMGGKVQAAFLDYDRDGRVDLFVGDYFQPVNLFKPDTPRFFPESFETANNGGGLTVWKNLGGGTFRDTTKEAGFALSGWTLDLGHADADLDGDDDLYVACDFGTDRFFVNNGDGTFRDATKEAIGIDTKKGMNAEWGDYDNDGWLDVFVTNITDEYMREGNFLWRNNGPGPDGKVTFSDVSRETGTHDTGWGWGGKFFDYDNDGWLDLYVVNGWVSAGPQSYVPDVFEMIVRPGVDLADARSWPPMGKKSLSGYQKKRLFHNQGGGLFKDEAARHFKDYREGFTRALAGAQRGHRALDVVALRDLGARLGRVGAVLHVLGRQDAIGTAVLVVVARHVPARRHDVHRRPEVRVERLAVDALPHLLRVERVDVFHPLADANARIQRALVQAVSVFKLAHAASVASPQASATCLRWFAQRARAASSAMGGVPSNVPSSMSSLWANSWTTTLYPQSGSGASAITCATRCGSPSRPA